MSLTVKIIRNLLQTLCKEVYLLTEVQHNEVQQIFGILTAALQIHNVAVKCRCVKCAFCCCFFYFMFFFLIPPKFSLRAGCQPL